MDDRRIGRASVAGIPHQSVDEFLVADAGARRALESGAGADVGIGVHLQHVARRRRPCADRRGRSRGSRSCGTRPGPLARSDRPSTGSTCAGQRTGVVRRRRCRPPTWRRRSRSASPRVRRRRTRSRPAARARGSASAMIAALNSRPTMNCSTSTAPYRPRTCSICRTSAFALGHDALRTDSQAGVLVGRLDDHRPLASSRSKRTRASSGSSAAIHSKSAVGRPAPRNSHLVRALSRTSARHSAGEPVSGQPNSSSRPRDFGFAAADARRGPRTS